MKYLDNPNPESYFDIGEQVYFYEPWSDSIMDGTIESFDKDSKGNKFACISLFIGGSSQRMLNQLFKSLSDAMIALTNANDARILEYKQKITNVKTLIEFAYKYPIAQVSEYTNWEARAAYRERAKEILDLDLELNC